METQALVLAPSQMQLHVDGTNVPAATWKEALKILATQALVHGGHIGLKLMDADGSIHAAYTIDHNSTVKPAEPRGNDAAAIIELSDWVLTSPGTQIHESFSSVATATDHLQHIANSSGTAVPVHLVGIGPSEASTITIEPDRAPEQEPSVPNGTDEPKSEQLPGNDEDYTTEEPDTSAVEADPEIPVDELLVDNFFTTDDEIDTAQPVDDDVISALEGIPVCNGSTAAEPRLETSPAPTRRKLLIAAMIAAILVVVLILTMIARAWLIPGSTEDSSSPAARYEQQVSTSQAPAASADGKTIALAGPDGFTFVDTDSGHTLHTDQSVVSSTTIYLAGKTGFLLASNDHTSKCDRHEDQINCQKVQAPSKSQKVSARAGSIAYMDNAHRDIASVLTGTKTTDFHTPANGDSYISQANDDHALWASAADGGSIKTATANGSVTTTAKLAAPAKATKLVSWLGPTSTGDIAVLWTGPKGTNVIATHDAATGKPTHEATIPEVNDGAKHLTNSGNALILGTSVFDAETGKVSRALGGKDVTATSNGFSLGTKYITAEGATFDEPHNGFIVTTRDDQSALAVIDGKLAVTDQK